MFGGSGWSPSCFLFEPRCFPFFPLAPFCRVFGGFVCLVCCAPSFSCPGFTVISLVLPLSLLVIALSLWVLALLFVLFLGLSSLFLAVSFLILPRLPLLCLSVGASWYVCRCGFVDVCAYCLLVLYCGCCLFVFLLVFISCHLFVMLFSSWLGFAGVLWCCLWGCVATRSWSVPSLTRRRVSLGRD